MYCIHIDVAIHIYVQFWSIMQTFVYSFLPYIVYPIFSTWCGSFLWYSYFNFGTRNPYSTIIPPWKSRFWVSHLSTRNIFYHLYSNISMIFQPSEWFFLVIFPFFSWIYSIFSSQGDKFPSKFSSFLIFFGLKCGYDLRI